MQTDAGQDATTPADFDPHSHPARARVSIRGARAAFVGPGLDLAPHRNAVAVVAVALRQPFELTWLDPGAPEAHPLIREASLIPPGRLHHLRARGPMAFVYLDALSDDHAALQTSELERRSEALREAARGAWSVDDLCLSLGLARKPPSDPRIATLLKEIDLRPDDFDRLEVAARFVGVSPSRCRELIRLTAGVPFRRYRLWRRFAIVMRELSRARSLTEAAQSAGFASSAHLSAAFKAMFGLAPSTLLALGVSLDPG
jgi:methylphosphotriester-DNA--protein-cysteine methyltransferase